MAKKDSKSCEALQSIPNGTKVKIDFKDLREEFLEEDFFNEAYMTDEDNGAECTVECLTMSTELGNQDHEYYDLKNIKTGKEYAGISGYNIIVIK